MLLESVNLIRDRHECCVEDLIHALGSGKGLEIDHLFIVVELNSILKEGVFVLFIVAVVLTIDFLSAIIDCVNRVFPDALIRLIEDVKCFLGGERHFCLCN
jgi:hypothetical protein